MKKPLILSTKLLSDNRLVRLLSQNPNDETLWREFLHRFNRFIASTILRECNRLNYKDGHTKVQDLLQEVYVKLLDHDCKALKSFRGRYKHSILKYLAIIAISIVRNDFSKSMNSKHKPEAGLISLSNNWLIRDKRRVDLNEILNDRGWKSKIQQNEILEEIEYFLKRICHNTRNGERNILIFRYYFYGGFNAKEIASFSEFKLTEKRISNLISEIKSELRQCLANNLLKESINSNLQITHDCQERMPRT